MKEILDKLHHDHVNASRLLDIYDQQLEILRNGGSPQYLVMRDIMKYMNSYPDIVHHPLEEIIFEKLEEKDDLIKDKVGKLYREHSEIDNAGDELLEILAKIAAGQITSLTAFMEKSEQYLELMRSHMNLEEGEVFPEIRKLLSDSDWEQIDTVLAEQNDPLFGKKVEKEYLDLYKTITGT